MKPLIRVHDLEVRYGSLVAVDSLSFEVEGGQTLALLGPNGAGKTSTVRCLVGVQAPSRGELEIAGFSLRTHPREAKASLAYIPEHGSVYEVLTPLETLELRGRLVGLEDDVIHSRAAHSLGVLGLEDRAHEPMTGFSKGMRQKVVLASALLTDPDVFILDEPLAGLDAETTQLVKELLALLTERGKAILYCSHLLDIVEKVADRILILSGGRQVTDGSLAELKEQKGTGSDLDQIFRNMTRASDPRAQAERLLAWEDPG